jgi:hypothetical protein
MRLDTHQKKEKLDKFFANEGYYSWFVVEVAAEVARPVVERSIAGLPPKLALLLGLFGTAALWLGQTHDRE